MHHRAGHDPLLRRNPRPGTGFESVTAFLASFIRGFCSSAKTECSFRPCNQSRAEGARVTPRQAAEMKRRERVAKSVTGRIRGIVKIK